MACAKCDCADCKKAKRPKPKAAPKAQPVRERANGFDEPPARGRLATMRGYSDAPLPERGT